MSQTNTGAITADQPFPGIFSPAILLPDTWQETKYIVYALPEPTAEDSPYYNLAATSPFFTFDGFGYTDSLGIIPGDLSV